MFLFEAILLPYLVLSCQNILLISLLSSGRSPIFSHLSSTLQGLTTVRAFRAQNRFVDKFDMYQDLHTESWFAFLTTVRWFGIMLDWLTAAFLIIVTFAAVVSKDCKCISVILSGRFETRKGEEGEGGVVA